MRECLIQRFNDDGDSTLGLMCVDHSFQAFTLEDQAQIRKVAGETRIPAGRYQLKLRKVLSEMTNKYRERFPWFTWHIEITGVPNFTVVYIHIGNTDKDTNACILLGDTARSNVGIGNNGSLGDSTNAFERWYKMVRDYLEAGEEIWLTIRDEAYLRGK